MKDIITITKYTIKENITKKSFIVSTILLIAIIVIICNIPNIINLVSGDDSEEETQYGKYIINDKENILGEDLNNIIEMGKLSGFEIEVNSNEKEEALEEKVRNNELAGVIEITRNEETGVIRLNCTVMGNYFTGNYELEQFVTLIKAIQVSKELKEANVSQETINNINANIEFETKTLNDENNNFGIAMASAFILFFAIYFYGNSVAVSVSSEKTSRVMETLVTSTKQRNIIIGKTLAMGIVSLSQLVILILTAVVSYKLFIPADMDFIANIIGNINLNVVSVLVCFVFFILGYTVYAFLNAVTGATISKVEDLQSAQTPIALIALFSFYLAYFTATMPDSGASKFASIFPFSAAFSMPGRILAGGATTWEIIISIAVLLITAVILAVISIKAYSNAVLHYGKRLNIIELFKISKEK
ncbi:MAG: ABC transporter permease [Clostridia bacterium]|nr:ABC transporter permease [Clostridia bacterium]